MREKYKVLIIYVIIGSIILNIYKQQIKSIKLNGLSILI